MSYLVVEWNRTGETMEQAVVREMHEETGLRIIPESVREYGYTHSVRKGQYEPVYAQDALHKNRYGDHGEENGGIWIERESRILEILITGN